MSPRASRLPHLYQCVSAPSPKPRWGRHWSRRGGSRGTGVRRCVDRRTSHHRSRCRCRPASCPCPAAVRHTSTCSCPRARCTASSDVVSDRSSPQNIPSRIRKVNQSIKTRSVAVELSRAEIKRSYQNGWPVILVQIGRNKRTEHTNQ